MTHNLLDWLADPPSWFKHFAAFILGIVLVFVAISFYAGPINKGLLP